VTMPRSDDMHDPAEFLADGAIFRNFFGDILFIFP